MLRKFIQLTLYTFKDLLLCRFLVAVRGLVDRLFCGKMVASRETRTELGKIPLRKQMRDTGLSHHTLLLIQRGHPVKKTTLCKVNAYLRSQTSKQNNE